ncbi:hypothetical protein L1887_55789 [Cichorium endivia]|nr:hypothetical protein L1887_55789 [Cichorium endivia]
MPTCIGFYFRPRFCTVLVAGAVLSFLRPGNRTACLLNLRRAAISPFLPSPGWTQDPRQFHRALPVPPQPVSAIPDSLSRMPPSSSSLNLLLEGRVIDETQADPSPDSRIAGRQHLATYGIASILWPVAHTDTISTSAGSLHRPVSPPVYQRPSSPAPGSDIPVHGTLTSQS